MTNWPLSRKILADFLVLVKFTVLHGTGSSWLIECKYGSETLPMSTFFPPYGIPAIFLTRFPDSFVFLIAPFSLVVRFQSFYLLLCISGGQVTFKK